MSIVSRESPDYPGEMEPKPGTLLSVEGVSVNFGGVRALDDVSLSVQKGQIVGLIGPNGAGKTTLLGVISGLQSCQRGRVFYSSRDVTKLSPHRRARLGMSRTFQRLELWDSMSVVDNIRAAAEFARSWRSDWHPEGRVGDLLKRFGLEDVADSPSGSLPSGLARVVEVARALALGPDLVLLDEPSAGLDTSESEVLADVLRGVNATGTAILLVEHYVEMVMSLCSSVVVLDFGRVIASGSPSEVRGNPEVQKAYLGAGR
jgi:branched-chain amino acid transport system ATP-binding protein